MSDYESIPTEQLVEIVAEVSQELARRPAEELHAARAARVERRDALEFEARMIEKALAYIEQRLAEDHAVREYMEQRLGADHEPSLEDAAVPEREQLPAPAETPVIEREPVAAAAAAVPARPMAERPQRAGARDLETKVLSAIISSNQPLSRAQVAERAGLTVGQVKKPLQRLVAAGKVRASGATVSRRYQGGEHQPHSEAGARTTAGRERSAATITDAVARVGLRDRVMKAVSADPASLDNHRLALALNATLEDIADACEWLVSKNKLQMHSDGTDLRSAAEAAREIAAA